MVQHSGELGLRADRHWDNDIFVSKSLLPIGR